MNDIQMTAIHNLQAAMKQAREVAGVNNLYGNLVYIDRRRLTEIAPIEDWKFEEDDGSSYCPVWITTHVGEYRFRSCIERQEAITLGILLPDPPGEPELPEPTLEELILI